MASWFDVQGFWKADAIRREQEDLERQRQQVQDYQAATLRLHNAGVQQRNEEIRRQNALAGMQPPPALAQPSPTTSVNALVGTGRLDSVPTGPAAPQRPVQPWGQMSRGYVPEAFSEPLAFEERRALEGNPTPFDLPPAPQRPSVPRAVDYVPEEFRPPDMDPAVRAQLRDRLLERAQQATKNPDLPVTTRQAEMVPEVKTWGEYQAVLQNAKMTAEFYNPLMEAASDNPALMKKIAEQYRKVPMPLFSALADVFETIQPGDDGLKLAYVDTTTAAGQEAARRIFGDVIGPGLRGRVDYTLKNGKPAVKSFTESKTTVTERTQTGKGPLRNQAQLDALQAKYKGTPNEGIANAAQIGDVVEEKTVNDNAVALEVTPSKPEAGSTTPRRTLVASAADMGQFKFTSPQQEASVAKTVGEGKKVFLNVLPDGTVLPGLADVEEVKKEKLPTQAFVLDATSRAFLASKIRPGDAAVRASLGSFKVDGKTEVTAEFDADGYVRSIGKAGTAPGVSVSVKAPGDAESGLFAGSWDSPEGKFGERAKNKPVFETQIILWMQALSKNPNARLFSAQGQRGAVLDSEAKQRVSDYMVSKGIPPEALVDAGAARSALPALKKQQANLEANAKVAEGGFARVRKLREEGGVSRSLSPLVNKTVNTLKNWTGDSYPGAAQGVLTEVLVDYAKVISGQTSTAGVTAYAAKLAEGLLPLSDNPAQFDRKLREYEGMMKTRLDAQKQVLGLMSRQAGMSGKDTSEDTGVHPWGHSVPPKKGMRLEGGKVIDEIFYNKKTKQYGVTYVQ